MRKATCQFCGKQIDEVILDDHEIECEDSQEDEDPDDGE